MKLNINSRHQAFAIHILISLFVIAVFVCITIYWWYPPPYLELDGGIGALRLLFIVSLILGPLLTLIVYKKGKPGLFFDLSVIACIQIAALIYGGNVIYRVKPSFIVFAVDRFTLVSDQDSDMMLLIGTDFVNSNNRGPMPVFTSLPEDINKRNDLLFGAFEGRADLEFRAEYYQPFLPNIKKAILRSKKISQYYLTDSNRPIINSFLESNKLIVSDLSFFPVVGKKKDMLLAVQSETGEIKGAIDIDPWIKD